MLICCQTSPLTRVCAGLAQDGTQHVMEPTGPIPALGEHTEAALRAARLPEDELAEVLRRLEEASAERPIYRGRL